MNPTINRLLDYAENYIQAGKFKEADKLLNLAHKIVPSQLVAEKLALCRTIIAKAESKRVREKDRDNEDVACRDREGRLEDPCEGACTSREREEKFKENRREDSVATFKISDKSLIDEENCMNVADTTKYLDKAQKAIANMDFKKAKEFLKDAEKLDPQLDLQDMHNIIQDAIFQKDMIDGYISSARDAIVNKNFETAEDNLAKVRLMDPEIDITEMLNEVQTGLDLNRKVSIKLDAAKRCIDGRKFETAEKNISEAQYIDSNLDVSGLWNTVQVALALKSIVNAYKKIISKTITKNENFIEEILQLFNAQMIDSDLEIDDVLCHVKVAFDYINTKYAGQQIDNTKYNYSREGNSRNSFDGKDTEELLLMTNTIGTQTEKVDNSDNDNITADLEEEEDQVYLKEVNSRNSFDGKDAEELLLMTNTTGTQTEKAENTDSDNISEDLEKVENQVYLKEVSSRNAFDGKDAKELLLMTNTTGTQTEKAEHTDSDNITADLEEEEDQVYLKEVNSRNSFDGKVPEELLLMTNTTSTQTEKAENTDSDNITADLEKEEAEVNLKVALEALTEEDLAKAAELLQKVLCLNLNIAEEVAPFVVKIKDKEKEDKQNVDTAKGLDEDMHITTAEKDQEITTSPVKTIEMEENIVHELTASAAKKCIAISEEAIANQDFKKAESFLKKAVRFDPRFDEETMLMLLENDNVFFFFFDFLDLKIEDFINSAQESIADKKYEEAKKILDEIQSICPQVNLNNMYDVVNVGLSVQKKVTYALERANKALEDGHLELADRILREIMNADPEVDISEMWHTLQTAIKKQKYINKSERDAIKAIEAKKFTTAQVILKRVENKYPEADFGHLWSRVQTGLASGRTNELIDHNGCEPNDKSNMDPNYEVKEVLEYVSKAQQAFTEGDFDKAELLMEKAISLNPREKSLKMTQLLDKIKKEKESQSMKGTNIGHTYPSTAQVYDILRETVIAFNAKYYQGPEEYTSSERKQKLLIVDQLVCQAMHALDCECSYLAEMFLEKANYILPTYFTTRQLEGLQLKIKKKLKGDMNNRQNLRTREAEMLFQMACNKFREKKYENAQSLAVVSEAFSASAHTEELLENTIVARYITEKAQIQGRKKGKRSRQTGTSEVHIFRADCLIEIAETFFAVGHHSKAVEYLEESMKANQSVKAQQMLCEIRSGQYTVVEWSLDSNPFKYMF